MTSGLIHLHKTQAQISVRQPQKSLALFVVMAGDGANNVPAWQTGNLPGKEVSKRGKSRRCTYTEKTTCSQTLFLSSGAGSLCQC